MKKEKPFSLARDRLIFAVLHELAGISAGNISKASKLRAKTNSEVSTVAPSTVRKWRTRIEDGGTRYPQAAKLDAALAVVNKKLGIVKI